MSNSKTKKQVRKNNDKSDKPEEVGIVWDSAIGLGIDYSPLTGRDICQSRYRNQKKHSRVNWNISSSGSDGKSRVIVLIMWSTSGSIPPFLPNFFFLPFQISYRIKGIYFQ